MNDFWKKHKGAIISTILGACVSAILVQTFNVANLTRSFRFQENRAILDSTRLGIGFLKQVENELNENLTLLLNNDYEVNCAFGKPVGTFDGMLKLMKSNPTSITNQQQAEQEQALEAYFKELPLLVHVDRLDVPTQQLSTEVWQHGAPEMADVDYDLLKELSDYYMLAVRINDSIKDFTALQIQPGGTTSPEMAKKLELMENQQNSNLIRIKDKNIVELKDKIEKEIQRLSLIRSKIIEQAH